MKKIFLFCIMIFLSFETFAIGKYEDNKYFITTDRLKIREDSELSSNVLTVLDKGTCLLFLKKGKEDVIDGKKDNWIKVKTIPLKGNESNCVEGWVYGGYVDQPQKEIKEFSDKKVKCVLFKKDYVDPKGIAGGSDYQYFFIENNISLVESIAYKTDYHGPNDELYCYSYERLENGKKIVYLAFTREGDCIVGVNIYSVDVSDYENSKRTYGYTPDENDKNVKHYVSYLLNDLNQSRNRRDPENKEYTVYKGPDFASEAIGTIGKNDFFILDVRMDDKLKFEKDKFGFWVREATAYDGIPFEKKEFNWIWIE